MAEVLSGRRPTNAGETKSLDGAELDKAWQEARKKYVKDFTPAAERVSDWHRRGAVECEHRRLWVGSVGHLDRLIAGGGSADLYARRARANAELHRWDAARTDYSKALEGEAERWDLWAGRAEVEVALRRWEQAIADYSRAIEHKGDRADLWAARGRVEAERGDWTRAAADLGKSIHLGNADVSVWQEHTLALLAGGDEANYRHGCSRLVQHFGRSDDEATARIVARTCTLADGAVRDLKPLLRRAERAVKANSPSAADLRRIAALLYRAGQYDAAWTRLQEITRLPSLEPQARDWLLMAMTTQRLGRGEEAKKWLAKADQVAREEAKEVNRSWTERIAYQVLHREAETLMKGTKH